MKTIWKWAVQEETTIDMPVGAKVLTVQAQCGLPQLWALVDPDAKRETRTFTVYGTGHDMPDEPGQYVGTFQQCEGKFVFHVFEGKAAS